MQATTYVTNAFCMCGTEIDEREHHSCNICGMRFCSSACSLKHFRTYHND